MIFIVNRLPFTGIAGNSHAIFAFQSFKLLVIRYTESIPFVGVWFVCVYMCVCAVVCGVDVWEVYGCVCVGRLDMCMCFCVIYLVRDVLTVDSRNSN